MDDLTLLSFGCAITFLAASGAYVVLRESFLHEFLSRRVRSRVRQPAPAERTAEEGARS